MRKNVFSCSTTGPAPVLLDSENYSSTFYLVTLKKEIDFGRKYGEQKNEYWSQKNYNKLNRRMQFTSQITEWNNANLPFISDKATEISVRRLR